MGKGLNSFLLRLKVIMDLGLALFVGIFTVWGQRIAVAGHIQGYRLSPNKGYKNPGG